MKLHYTWILVIALVTAIVTTQFPENYPLWQRITLGIVVSLLFLAAVIIREIILCMAAFRREIPARKMTLFVFGSAYQEKRDRIIDSPIVLLVLARFLSNLVIVAIFYGLYATFVNANNAMMAGVAQWLTYIYFLLFLLHFVPVYPLDGGKILQMVLWRSNGDYYRATHIAGLTGWAAGLFLIFIGVLVFIVTQQAIISLVVVSSGWIIWIAARQIRRHVKTYMVLQRIRAQDVMTRDYPVMPQQVNIGQLIREHILIKGWPYIIVTDGNRLKGILTMNQIKSVPGKNWNNTTVGDIMTPYDQIRTANLHQSADILLEEMHRRGIDYIPVLDEDNIVGVVNRVALMSLSKTRIGFGA